MKTLHVTEAEQFRMLYESLVIRQSGYNIQQSRIVGKILDKMEAAGEVVEVNRGVSLYGAKQLPSDLQLEDAAYTLASNVFAEALWAGISARSAVKVADWLAKAAQEEAARG